MDPVQRLVDAYDSIPEDVRVKALDGDWYWRSRQQARRLARLGGVSVRAAAGIIAALSPNTLWKANITLAEHVLLHSEPKGFRGNWKKAERIRDGERPLSVLRGPKVRAFYRAIMGDEDAAVLDRWMWRAMGFDEHKHPAYEVGQQILADAAAIVGLPTATFQMVVWTGIRGGGE
jgi:hypothetical protein